MGLTGGIGSGKSAVSSRLAEHGAIIVDADQLARDVVAPGTPGLAAVADAFGAGVLRPDGSLDREALGRTVFADPAARGRLEGIVHPLIRDETARRFGDTPPDAIVIHDIPLLVEAGLAGGYDTVVVVQAPRELRLERLEARGLPRDQAEARMANQADDDARRAVADVVLDNSGTLAGLHAQVDALWRDLLARRDAARAT
ncbi:dephospho-CoA kinase [Frankia sp. CNm7]|uniref:Dephospho-CoA kinase n=1 Tax=Frankia nepalensis TaxID=1836974 RepID=A0A937RRR6_9ACTN|nr:dephospho-CoA kinase [Frankia nepalensis]MBL7497421.1 dephospho-CoA kinase [Frankia nepalensis]MBL7512743.1 dephospho-CoA kinase [Frankia nepalensis]MBL7522927.1 dephospho-CoA kinase [Frankia nepalensis]MBL7632154.1 dephospho-CoA kinase [Frankia nepalensis]